MKKIIEKYTWLQLILGLILLAVGVLTIVTVVNAPEDYQKILFIMWPITLFVVAGLVILFDVLAFNKTAEFGGLITSGICIGIGVFVLINRALLQEAIVTLLPYIMMSIGGVLLFKTIILAVKRVSFKEWLLAFIVSIVFIAGGIVFLVIKDSQKFLYIVLGILLIVLGAVEIIGYITILVNRRKEDKVTPPSTSTRTRKGGGSTKEEYTEPESVSGVKKEIDYDDPKLIE